MITCRYYKYWAIGFMCCSLNAFSASNISGIWKHSQKPAWLEITFASGVGALSVKRHDNNPNAVGLNVIKDIQLDSKRSSQWVGQMYSALENSYVSVRLVLINPNTLAVFAKSDVNSNEILRIVRE